MAKTLLVQLLSVSGEKPREEELRSVLEAEGVIGPDDRLRIVEVTTMPLGPPSMEELAEMRGGLELNDDDDLEVMAVRSSRQQLPPLISFADMFAAMMLAELIPPPLADIRAFVCNLPGCPFCGDGGILENLAKKERLANPSSCDDPNCLHCAPTPRVPTVPLPEDES